MAQSYSLKALDTMLRVVCRGANTTRPSTIPFGGKVVLLGGDFRQVLPIVPRGSPGQIINRTVKNTDQWRLFDELLLTENMRTGRGEEAFAEWLEKLGDGRLPTIGDDVTIELP